MSEQVPRIVTDSTADIPPQVARGLDITVIPCQIHFGGQTYREGIDLSRQEFYRRLRSGERFTTSQPAVGVFAETYRQVLAAGRPIVSIHLAAALSGVYNAARLAAAEVSPEQITVIDGQQVSMATGWLAIRAAEAVQRGSTLREVVQRVEADVPRLRVLAVIDDLRYLQRSGRVNWAAGLVGHLFAIKPVIGIKAGRIELLEKARLRSRGLERMVRLAMELGRLERVAVLHADVAEVAMALAERLERTIPGERLLVTETGSIISGHAGPGTVGLACLIAE